MSQAWQEVRVFISSTFRDMQAERDHLTRFVFPRLREALAKRRIRMVDVDLRWGVTADQDAFDLCMREIEDCHPRFLCILGGRYGWVPPPAVVGADFMDRLRRGKSEAGALSEDELALLERVYPQCDAAGNCELRAKPESVDEVNHYNAETSRAVALLQRAGHVETERSITASEVFFGALDRLHEPTFRYFYFRADELTRSIPDSHSGIYREPEGSFGERELASLKQRIRSSRGVVRVGPDEEVEGPVPVYDYPGKWDERTHRITNLKEFGDRVYADLVASVEAQFGASETGELPWFEEERAAIEAFVEPRVERYVVGSRGDVFDRLHSHLAGSGGTGILVLVGEPGSGKSALLARLWRELERGTPDHPARTDALVITHFVGASAASTNLRQLLRRLCHELQAGTGIEGEIPDDFEKLRAAFPDFLERAAQVRPVLLLVDAVNQLDPDYQALALRWLPETLPANARAILTVLEKPSEKAPALEALRARRTPPEDVPLRALTETDAQEIVNQFLARCRKSLDAMQRSLLLAKRDNGKPLYLLTALEELRTLGVYEEITTRIEQMPEETQPLFLWILKRLEGDDGFRDEGGELIGPTLVRSWCSYLAAGRAGMSQGELAELVAPARARRPDDPRDPEPDELGNVAALQRLLRPYLMARGALLDFFHGQLKEAVLGEYLHEPQERIDTHRAIAAHFLKRADPAGDKTWSSHDARALSELPFHQTEGRMWDEIYGVLTDLGFLEEKCTWVAATTVGEGDDERIAHNGVFELQEDYRRALEVWPEKEPAPSA
jgi:hypothetical protein